ncbi:MAG: DUF2330 domain-containing protein, partial [Sandaracinaceae bacterium]|nr:DUF2330 domain-containing protein [Sandaracinaceae bacterium]
MSPRSAWMYVVLGAATLGALPEPAHACGGFFCNRQQIDQAGERILFAYEPDGSVTTVVQIQYTGPSESFAWILPVPAEPTVDVGTDELFRQLELSTAPRVYLDPRTVGRCRQEPSCPWAGWETAFDSDRAGAPGASADAGAPPPSVEVTFRGSVGPYDVAVLAAIDPTALRTWLVDNDYFIPDSAASQLDHYVALGHHFVALKLLKDRASGEIQPIVLRSSNRQPCIPIILTAIATVPDMPITAYFLADRRARPFNYMLVNPDLESVDLWMRRESWSQMVTRVVDDVGGHGFVTDYAGEVPAITLSLESIDDLRTITDPAEFLRVLQSRGFNGDSQLLGILQRFIPPPEGVQAQQFYNGLVNGGGASQYASYLAILEIDYAGLVDALDRAIVRPRADADAMLRSHTHLTRLFTTLSAGEMTEDPEFMLSSELPRAVSNEHTTPLVTHCSQEYFSWTAPQTLVLPSGTEAPVREGVRYLG